VVHGIVAPVSAWHAPPPTEPARDGADPITQGSLLLPSEPFGLTGAYPFKSLVGRADDPGMDLPGTETERVTHERRHRPLVVFVLLTVVVLGSVGVAAAAFVGHNPARVVASATATQSPANPTAHAPDTTTTRPPLTTTTVKPVSPTTVTAAAAARWATTPSTTARYVPPPTGPTTPPATSPPTSAAPKTAPIVATTASLQINPSTANFPSTPPPYWPMPIVRVTITNTGGVAARSVVVHPVGVYSVPSSTCTTLIPGHSCVAEVQFCPTSPNHYLDTLMVTGQDAVSGSSLHASITLDGTAT
jgi:hypothetical protein